MSLLTKGLRAAQALAEAAAKKAEEMDVANLEIRSQGVIDLDKARALIAELNKEQAQQNTAIDQLQQRVSNLESLVGRLEARSPAPPRTPIGWVEPR